MAEVPKVSPQAGRGGAELPEMGALLRHLQESAGQSGAPVTAVAGVKASGTITFSGTGTAADTITVGEAVITLVASDAGENEAVVGGTAADTRDNVLAALNVVAAAQGVSVAASSTAAITVTALAAGVAGNDIDLAESSDDATVSGAKLSGGVDQVLGTAAPAGSIRVDGTKAYIAVTDTTTSDTSGWKEITIS